MRSIQINPVLTLWNSGGSLPSGMVRMHTWAGNFFQYLCACWCEYTKEGEDLYYPKTQKFHLWERHKRGVKNFQSPLSTKQDPYFTRTLPNKVTLGMKTMWDFDRRQKWLGHFVRNPLGDVKVPKQIKMKPEKMPEKINEAYPSWLGHWASPPHLHDQATNPLSCSWGKRLTKPNLFGTVGPLGLTSTPSVGNAIESSNIF